MSWWSSQSTRIAALQRDLGDIAAEIAKLRTGLSTAAHDVRLLRADLDDQAARLKREIGRRSVERRGNGADPDSTPTELEAMLAAQRAYAPE